MRDRNRTSINILASFLHGHVAIFMHELLWHLFAQIDRQEALREFDSVESRPQRLQDLLPVPMAGQAASRRTSDAMLAIQLDVERVESVAAGRQCDTDGVVVGRFTAGRIDVVLRFV